MTMETSIFTASLYMLLLGSPQKREDVAAILRRLGRELVPETSHR